MFEHEDSSNDSGPSNPRAGDTPGFGSGGGGSVGGGGGYGAGAGGAPAGGGAPVGGDRGGNDRGGEPSGPPQPQGRGSNVTDARPQPPSVTAMQNQDRSAITPIGFPGVNAPQGGWWSPSGGNYQQISQSTVGVPSIVLDNTRPPQSFSDVYRVNPVSTSTVAPGTQGVDPYAKATPYSGPHGQTMTNEERWAGGGVFNNLEHLYNIPDGTLGKIMRTESSYGNNPDAFQLKSGPSGPFQISKSTGEGLGVVGPGFDYRLDPVESAAAAAKYAAEISSGLRSVLGRAPTTGEIGLGYQQGTGGAKALLTNPDLSAKEALAKALNGDVNEAARRIKANGGDPDAPASQFTSQKISQYGGGSINTAQLMTGMDKLMNAVGTTVAGAGNVAGDVVKAALSTPAKFADTLESFLNPSQTPAIPSNVPLPTPVVRSYQDAGSSPDANVGAPAAASSGEAGFNVPSSAEPESILDWVNSGFSNEKQINYLLDQPNRIAPNLPNTTSGMTKEEWASEFNVDPSEVKERISTINGAPQVDFYTKDLGQALFGDPMKAVGEGISSLFGGSDVNKLPHGSYVRDRRFSDIFSPTESSRGYGPNGDMTYEEYLKEYGGKDRTESQKQASNDPSNKPATQPPAEPVYTTGIDTAIRNYVKKYNPNYYPDSAYS